MSFMVSTRKLMLFANLILIFVSNRDMALFGWTTSPPTNPISSKTLMLNILSIFPDPNSVFEVYFEVQITAVKSGSEIIALYNVKQFLTHTQFRSLKSKS